jgi:hypothetical protein
MIGRPSDVNDVQRLAFALRGRDRARRASLRRKERWGIEGAVIALVAGKNAIAFARKGADDSKVERPSRDCAKRALKLP